MKLPRRNFLHLAAAAAALPMTRIARAQAYPSRPVRLSEHETFPTVLQPRLLRSIFWSYQSHANHVLPPSMLMTYNLPVGGYRFR
jgi:hypothetical protein